MGRFTKLERPLDAPPLQPGTGGGLPGAPGTGAAGDSTAGGQAGATTRWVPQPAPPGQPGMGAPTTGADSDLRDYPTLLERADTHFFSGEYEKALRFYSRALQAEATRQYPWVGQLYSLLLLGQVKEAELWASRALELFPEDPALLAVRAVVFARRGMMERAIGASDYSMSRGSSPFCWLARGEVLLIANNKNASACFDKAIEATDPLDWKIPFRAGLACFGEKYYTGALEYFQKVVERRGANFWLWHHLGICYARLGFRQQAIDAQRQAMVLRPEFKPATEALEALVKAPLTERIASFFRRDKR